MTNSAPKPHYLFVMVVMDFARFVESVANAVYIGSGAQTHQLCIANWPLFHGDVAIPGSPLDTTSCRLNVHLQCGGIATGQPDCAVTERKLSRLCEAATLPLWKETSPTLRLFFEAQKGKMAGSMSYSYARLGVAKPSNWFSNRSKALGAAGGVLMKWHLPFRHRILQILIKTIIFASNFCCARTCESFEDLRGHNDA